MYFDPSDRVSLKAYAKSRMKACAPNIFLVSLLFLVLNYLAGRVTQRPTIQVDVEALANAPLMDSYSEAFRYVTETFLSTFSAGRLAAIALATFAMSLFLTVVKCGWMLYCLRASRGEDTGSFETLFSCFKQFGRFVVAELLMELFTLLWMCLFIIPGIVAAFSYTQTFYLMLDDPSLSPLEAIRKSKELMRGHKAEFFVLELSFLGWQLLSLLLYGLLNIWLQPYMDVTVASYYNGLINWRAPQPEEEAPPPPPDADQWWKQ